MKCRNAAVAAAAIGLVMAGGAAIVSGSASAAATGCSVNYTVVGQWPGGFQQGSR